MGKTYIADNFKTPSGVNLALKTSKTYCEIGDSISFIGDGKKEDLVSEYGSATGYIYPNGYGQKICKHFGISYANHKSHGMNGKTFAEYMLRVNTPPNSDTIYDLPQNSDIYTIFLGTNDFGKSEPLGAKSDYLNDTFSYASYEATKTTYGALRKLVDYVTSTTDARDKRIIFITPLGFGTYTGFGSPLSTWEINVNGEIVEKTNSAGVKMSDIVLAIKWAASQIGAYVIDLYDTGGIVQKNRLNIEGNLVEGFPEVYQTVLYDNLHPTTEGFNFIAKRLIAELDKIIINGDF